MEDLKKLFKRGQVKVACDSFFLMRCLRRKGLEEDLTTDLPLVSRENCRVLRHLC